MDLGWFLPGSQDPASQYNGKCYPRGVHVSKFPAKEIHTLGILGAEKQKVAGPGFGLSVSGESNRAADTCGPQGMRTIKSSLLPPLSPGLSIVPSASRLLNKPHE